MTHPRLIAAIAGSTLAVLTSFAVAREEEGADALPIKRITLYRSGVGSFERQGSIDGDGHVSLRFETGQINDILKSLVLLDLDGGKVGAVGYGSKEPLDRRLAGFEVNLSGAPSIETLFRQLRGAKVKLTGSDAAIEGTILNVENRKTIIPAQGGAPGHFDEPYVSIITAQGVRSVAISRIGSFEFADPKLAEELNRALSLIAEQRADRLKSVDLSFNGPAGKARRVVAAYVHETPVWKASYRLVLPEDGKSPLIQGWAIVENTTDTDWDNVTLSLASGRPVSFTMDLYEPVYGARPSVPVPVPGALAGRNFEDGTRADKRQLSAAPASAPTSAAEMASNSVAEADSRGIGYRYTGSDSASSAFGGGTPSYDSLQSSAQATGSDAGEQFLYTVSAPVSVPRQRSAMLPIIGTEIQANRVSIFNPSDGLKNPMRGVKLTNSTGLHLMPGPISVFDAGVYAGDAQIPHTSRDAERLLAYALDLDVTARAEISNSQTVSRITVSAGRIMQKITYTNEAVYTLDVRDKAKGRTIVVEHSRRPTWDLVEPKAPTETTDTLYRFEVDAPADKVTTFKVVERFVGDSTMAITEIDLKTLLYHSTQGHASPAVVEAVKKAGEMQAQISATRSAIDELARESQSITNDQSRVRENMARIDRNSDLYTRYMKKLNEQETRVEKISEESIALQDKLRTQEAALNDYLSKLDVE